MLNQKGQRELCYVVKVDCVKPIEGKDRVECAVIGGWTCMIPKGQFKDGDLGIYFEIDSKVDFTKMRLSLQKNIVEKLKHKNLELKMKTETKSVIFIHKVY